MSIFACASKHSLGEQLKMYQRQLVPVSNLNSYPTNKFPNASLFQILMDNLSVPILHFVYKLVSKITTFEQLRNVKLGMGALFIYYAGLVVFLQHVGFLCSFI